MFSSCLEQSSQFFCSYWPNNNSWHCFFYIFYCMCVIFNCLKTMSFKFELSLIKHFLSHSAVHHEQPLVIDSSRLQSTLQASLFGAPPPRAHSPPVSQKCCGMLGEALSCPSLISTCVWVPQPGAKSN